ncbi:MAG: sugar ABC transporter substrate-binding protein [Magnetospirillum sp.]|jgi:multiple sugar transport system substrate-binding protein|nr:sugar ABC transporter substrate-binding protein [Magnetospirillum sp.]
MHQKIARRSFVVGSAAAAGILAAPAIRAQTPTTITFRFNDPEAPQMRAALDEFERANPTIKVNMQRISWADMQAQYLREAATGTAPDVVHISFVQPRSFGGGGALRALDDLIKRDGASLGAKGWEDFFARDLAEGADGKIYAVPWTTDTFTMMYNTEMFAQAGITAFPTSWDGLRAASRTVAQRTGKAGWGFPAGSCATPSIWFYINYFFWSNGPGWIDKAADGKYVMGVTPAQAQEALEYFKSYIDEGHNPRSNMSVCLWGAPELVEAMLSGNTAIASVPDTVAMEILAKWEQRNPGKKAPFATAPHPGGRNGSVTNFGGRMLGISPNARNVEQAWRLIRFLVTPEPTFTKHYTNYTPAQRSALTSRNWAPELAGYPRQLANSRSWGPYATGPVPIPFMWNAVGRAAGSVFIGEKTPAVAAAELHETIARELARTQR